MKKYSSTCISHGIEITAEPNYIPENSNPKSREYIFAYNINIKNTSDIPVKIISRHWVIIDSNGHRDEVQGAGIIGQTPLIEPGESFEYDSYCPLKADWGTMEGTYIAETPDGNQINLKIGRFYLVVPK